MIGSPDDGGAGKAAVEASFTTLSNLYEKGVIPSRPTRLDSQSSYVFAMKASPDMVKARRRVETLDPETRFALPTCVRFDTRRNRLYVVDSQRWRIQIFDKLDDYAEPQFNI